MSISDKLRHLLDEHGTKWWAATPCKTKWNSPILGGPVAAREWNGEMVLDTGYVAVTPKQIIAATLGRGTCHNINTSWPSLFECDKCGYSNDDTYCGSESHFKFCPNCGAKVVNNG